MAGNALMRADPLWHRSEKRLQLERAWTRCFRSCSPWAQGRPETVGGRSVSLKVFCLLASQGFGKADQILRSYLNEAVAWGVNVRYQHERDGNDQAEEPEAI